jgi:hypothetical protein
MNERNEMASSGNDVTGISQSAMWIITGSAVLGAVVVGYAHVLLFGAGRPEGPIVAAAGGAWAFTWAALKKHLAGTATLRST